MALRISEDLKNEVINHIITKVAGTCYTAGTAVIKIYTGSQPTNADTAPSGTSGTMLCEIIAIGWAAGTCGATAGTAALASAVGYTGTAAATGTAGWARIQTVGSDFTGSAGTYNIDGDVAVGGGAIFTINSVSITSGGSVTLLTAPISIV
jgi:hypothetical protein